MCNCVTCESAKQDILLALNLYNKFKWIIDSYVLDFYVNDHWSLLPNSWKQAFKQLTPSEIGTLLDPAASLARTKYVYPLEILCLRKIFQKLILPRKPICLDKIYSIPTNHNVFNHSNNESKLENITENRSENILLNHPRLKNSFWKRISPKKKHEITVITQICSIVARHTDCNIIVDFGSGLGHLSRILAYGFGLTVCCLEAQQNLSLQAQKLDTQFEVTASKHLSPNQMKELVGPVHINTKIENTADLNDLVQLVKSALKIKDDHYKFGVVGLHPCGDLAAVLLKFFKENENVKFINMASCCYMKLSTEDNAFTGYPLSKFVSSKEHTLSYISRELACHAIESYVERLNNEDYMELKTHAFRATLEKIIVNFWPDKKHAGLRNAKCNKDLTFHEYCLKATNGMDIQIPEYDIISEKTKKCLSEWKKVMIYYSLRLMFAPMIETIVLLDRLLYVAESDIECALMPVFDPKLSPRNHILIATKNCK